MRELRFDGLSPDGTRLILAGKDGQKWSVVIDERIEAAVRRDRARIGQVEIEQAGMLRPREIQARIRSGQTAEDVAAASGLPIEHIRRFEGPVLTERAWVAQQAQSTEVRRPGADIELGDLVAERLQSEGVDAADIAWDAWRRDDGTWVVIATFPLPPNTHVATWTFDSASRTMTVVDDNARSLSAIDPDAPLHLAASRPMLATVAPIDDEPEGEDEPAVLTSMPAWGARGAVPEEPADDDDMGAEAPEAVDAQGSDELWDEAESGTEADSGTEAEADAGSEADESSVADESEVDDEDDTGFEPATAEDLEEAPADKGPGVAGAVTGADEVQDDERDGDAPDDGADDNPDGDAPEPDLETGPTADAEDVPLFQTPAAPAPRPTGKPSVPSFDDILFGPGPGK